MDFVHHGVNIINIINVVNVVNIMNVIKVINVGSRKLVLWCIGGTRGFEPLRLGSTPNRTV